MPNTLRRRRAADDLIRVGGRQSVSGDANEVRPVLVGLGVSNAEENRSARNLRAVSHSCEHQPCVHTSVNAARTSAYATMSHQNSKRATTCTWRACQPLARLVTWPKPPWPN